MLEGAERVVFGAHLEDKALAALDHDTGRPDLDLDRNDLSGLQLLQLVVGVERTPRLRALRIELNGHLKGTSEGGCVTKAFGDFHVAPFEGEPVTVKMLLSLP